MMHISKTQINSYLRCPFAYHCRYILGMKIPPTSSMTLGRCFDHCINVDYTAKIKTGKDEPVSVLTDAFVTLYDEEKKNTVFLEDEKPEKLKDTTIPAIKKFHAEVCSIVKPATVQLEDQLQFNNVDYTLSVVVDCIDEQGVIIDNKLARRTFGDATSLLDAPIYGTWYLWKYGKLPKGFSYDVAITTKEPKVERVPVSITELTIQTALRKIALIKDSIEHDTARDAFFPNTRSFLCSRKLCGYWRMCEEHWNHTIKE